MSRSILPSVISAILIAGAQAANFAFLSIGDWGGAALDAQASDNVYAVSAQMATTAAASSAQFIVNTGDNFYWCGIQNTSDFQISVDFEKPYANAALQVPWYSALGNHEYGYNVQAQIDYMKLNPVWHMPDRNFTQRIQLDSTHHMTLLFVDTSPCISDYRNDNPSYWDPCSTTYPTCSQTSTDDDFEGPCMFHENILGQSCQAQYAWLQGALDAVPADDWLVIVGHHPSDEVDVEDFTALYQQRGFAMYLNGHTHTLNQYTVDGAGTYITTGAGSLVDTADQEFPITLAKHEGRDVTPSMRKAHLENMGATQIVTYSDHTYKQLWSQKVAGFTKHTFNSAFTQLTTEFVSYTGAIVRTITTDKNGNPVAAADIRA